MADSACLALRGLEFCVRWFVCKGVQTCRRELRARSLAPPAACRLFRLFRLLASLSPQLHTSTVYAVYARLAYLNYTLQTVAVPGGNDGLAAAIG